MLQPRIYQRELRWEDDRTMGDGFVRIQGREILTPDGKPLISRGMGLGMWLVPEGYMFRFKGRYERPRTIEGLTCELIGPEESRHFWRHFKDAFFTEADAEALVRHGFDTIRIPFDYRLLSSEEKPGEYLEEGFRLLDNAIHLSRKHGLWVILDMHCAPGGQTGHNIDNSWGDFPWLFESEADMARTCDIWQEIARRYVDDPTVMGYDLLNEPLPEARKEYWPRLEPLYRRIVEAVREVDQDHLIFLEGANWSSDFSMFDMPMDSQMVYGFHKYWNENTEASIQRYLDLRETYNVPLWLGETGENSTQWYREYVDLVESKGIGWNFWPWKKMVPGSSPYTIEDPPYWDEITAYTNGGPRPSVDHARAAFEGLLENIRLENCVEEQKVISALTGRAR